jgi:predicted transporter
METTLLIKIILMATFFLEVIIFGRFISNMNCFKQGNIMSLAMTFSGTLFLSIAMLDIIPEAIASFDMYFAQIDSSLSSSSSIHQNEYLPLTMIIACSTFMIIMYIDKILIGHSHDHEYDVSFIKEPRKSQRDLKEI